MDHESIQKEFILFLKELISYFTFRLSKAGFSFEKIKNFIVDALMVKRGANTPLFLHLSILGLAIAVLVGGGVFSSTSIVSGSYPGVPVNPLVAGASDDLLAGGVISSSITPVTVISDKPRDKIIDYEVKSGDTIASIADQFGVSDETILWANNLSVNSTIVEGKKLQILPVSGVVHKVESGDTIYSIAKKYRANPQAIIDFPFNDIGDNFAVTSGQTLIVPDGAPPEGPKPAPTQYLAQQNIPIADLGSARFIWPVGGVITQYFSWYHPGIDIATTTGTPIVAADSGTVVVAGWVDNFGFGNRVMIDHGNGYKTLYAHQSAIYVSVGQKVSKGDVIGAVGSTGRSTGAHLHFEIHKDDVSLNPPSLLGK